VFPLKNFWKFNIVALYKDSQTNFVEKTIQTIPFLRLCTALATGIFLCTYIVFPFWLVILFFTLFLLLQFFLNLNYKFHTGALHGISVHLFLVSAGIFLYHNYNLPTHFFENGKFIATVLEIPQEKQNSYQSLLKIEFFQTTDLRTVTNEKVLVYFEKDTVARNLKPGEKILFDTSPQALKNNGNPFEFDYKRYMGRRKIYRQVYLPSEKWIKTRLPESKSVIVKAELFRKELLEIYEKHKLGENEFEILSALTLGYKRDLDPEIQQVFSASGAMHVLAVSGLHVGIIYGFFTFLLGFMNRKKIGRLIFAIMSVSLIWSFAFITGLSPSVMRASTMFSFVILGKCINRQTNIYNTLAASAFILLLINPNNLFEVGFQLSYAAVFGIVFLQPKLAGLFNVKNKILNYFQALLTVSVAAQILTFPFSVYYFNQFPTYFWISNLFVIPAAVVLIPLAIGMLVFSGIPVISILFSKTVNFIISILYSLLKEIEEFPVSVLNISINEIEFILTILLLCLIFIFIKTYNIRLVTIILTVLFLLTLTSTVFKIKTQNQKEIIVYNNTQNRIIQFISGKMNYVITDKELPENSFEKKQIQTTSIALRLKQPIYITSKSEYQDANMFFKNGNVFFDNKFVVINKMSPGLFQQLKPEIIIDPPINKELNDYSDNVQVVFTGKKYQDIDNDNKKFYWTEEQGAFRKKW
jgi:competence protein ComEC